MARRRQPQSNQMVFVLILLGTVFLGGAMVIGLGVFIFVRSSSGTSGSGLAGFSGKPYSQRHRETTLPANQAALDTPLRAHRDHPWVTLKSASVEQSDGRRIPLPFWRNGERALIDYESSADFTTHPVMTHARAFVMLKNERGEEIEWVADSYDIFKPQGGWELDDSTGFPGMPRFPGHRFPGPPIPGPFGGASEKSFTPNMELFVVLEDRFDPKNVMRFKISNSLTIGDKAHITLARDWTDAEAVVIEESVRTRSAAPAAPPAVTPAAPPPNSTKSPLLGGTGGGLFVNARSGAAVIGLQVRLGQWANQPAIAGVMPMYGAGPALPNHQQIMARDGYVVGGLRVELKTYVTGLQVIFMKANRDGVLDPSDQYVSDWIRATPGAEQPPLLSEGKKVIGIHGRAAAVVDAIGLVYE